MILGGKPMQQQDLDTVSRFVELTDRLYREQLIDTDTWLLAMYSQVDIAFAITWQQCSPSLVTVAEKTGGGSRTDHILALCARGIGLQEAVTRTEGIDF